MWPQKTYFLLRFLNAKEIFFLGKSCCLSAQWHRCSRTCCYKPVHRCSWRHAHFCTSVQYLIPRAVQPQGRALIGCTAVQEGPCCPLPPLAAVLHWGLVTLLKHVALCKAEQLKPSPTAEGVSCLLVVISCFMEKVNAHFLAERFCFNKAETGIPALLSEYRREVYVKTTSFLLKNLHNGKWKLSFLFTKLFWCDQSDLFDFHKVWLKLLRKNISTF